MIQLSQDGAHRARTWHWFRDEALWRITLVRERRESLDPADFDRPARRLAASGPHDRGGRSPSAGNVASRG